MITELTLPSGLRCMAHIPETTTKKPLLVFLHGIGERGTDLSKVMKYGPIRQIQDGVDIRFAKDWIIVHPQNPSGNWSIEEMDEPFTYLPTKYPVDDNQLFLMGASHGGMGTWTYAQSPEHVKKLAAIVPICGGGNDPSKAHVLVSDGVPGWAAHALSDRTVPYSTTKRMVDAVNDLAGKSQILLSSYGMSGHGAWNYFLRPEYGVYDWLRYQRRSHKVYNPVVNVPVQTIEIKSGESVMIKSV
jgi:predicted peptidase